MFSDREDAAGQLAAILRDCPFKDPLVLAISGGGVVTGAVLSRELGAEFDLVLSRKLRAPDQPELAIGAISEDGEVYLIADADESPGVSDDYFHLEKQHQLSLIASQRQHVRRIRPKASVKNRSVIVADDGIATGSTMIAALQTIRTQEPAELIVAVPVARADRIRTLHEYCDKVVCLVQAEHFWSVGQFYEDFPAIDEERVLDILRHLAPQRA